MLKKEIDLRYKAESALREKESQMPSNEYKNRSLRSDFAAGKDLSAMLGHDDLRRPTFADTVGSAGERQFSNQMKEVLSNGQSPVIIASES